MRISLNKIVIEKHAKSIVSELNIFLSRYGIYLCIISMVFYSQLRWLRLSNKGLHDIELRLFIAFFTGLLLAKGVIQFLTKFITKDNKETLYKISMTLSPGIFFILCSRYTFFLYIIPLLCILGWIVLNKNSRKIIFLNKYLSYVSFLLFFLGSAGILYSAFCAFTSYRFALTDYGKYTNMLWNSLHGKLFRELMDYSYLGTHLSFTLILLSPFFYLWNHPFLLSFVQWLSAMVGMIILWRIAIKNGIDRLLTGSFLLLATLNPYTQQVLLCEFHSTGLYFLLMPLLYYFILYNKKLVFIPLILLYGIREDSAFIALPILFYFAVKDKWKWGYIWFSLSLCYGLFACFPLFKWINGFYIFSKRPGVKFKNMKRSFKTIHYLSRLKKFLPLYIPAIPLLKKSWVPLLIFPSVSILMAFFSPYPVQANLRYHYPTPIIVCLIIALLHSIIQHTKQGAFKNTVKITLFSVFLITSTLVSHHIMGFIPGGHIKKYYTKIDPQGLLTLKAAHSIPQKGVLLCSSKLASFCANRADLIEWSQFYHRKHMPDIIFFRIPNLNIRRKKIISSFLERGKFGVKYFDGCNGIIVKRYSTKLNQELINLLNH